MMDYARLLGLDKDAIDLYILRLEGNRYYVGQSKYAKKRISKHFKGRGSAWTKAHPPVEVIRVWNSGLSDWKEVEMEECRITLELMIEHGWRNVRGGFWSTVEPETTYKNLLHHRQLIGSFGFSFARGLQYDF